MPSLIIDTSSTSVLLALTHANVLIDQKVYLHANQLSATLIPSIQELLEKNGIKMSAINRVVAGMGPGSYTGTRVGVAVAKTLSFGLKAPFTGFCSLLANIPLEKGPFALVLPSKLNQFYLVKGIQDETISLEISALLSEEELAFHIKDVALLHCNTPTMLLKPCLPLSFNASALIRYLSSNPATSDELIYLHNSP